MQLENGGRSDRCGVYAMFNNIRILPPASYLMTVAFLMIGYGLGALLPALAVEIILAIGLLLFPWRHLIRKCWVAVLVRLGKAMGYGMSEHYIGSRLVKWRFIFGMTALAMVVGLSGSVVAVVPMVIFNYFMWERRLSHIL